MDTTDSSLWERWERMRDADAFAELVARHSGMVYATCKRVLGNAAEAEDAAQECFLELVNGRVQVGDSIAPWLYTVAVRRALNRAEAVLRRRRREQHYLETARSTSEIVLDDLLPLVDAAIAELPETLREPLVFHFLQGQSYAEIARRSGVAESTVRHRTKQALEQVRALLKQRGALVSVTALSAALLESMATAAPPSLISALNKVAIAGVPAPSATALVATTFGGLIIMKQIIVCAVLLVAVVAGIWVLTPPDGDRTALEAPAPGTSASELSASEATADTAGDLPPDGGPVEVSSQIPVSETAEPDTVGIRVAGLVLDDTGNPVDGARVMAGISRFSNEETISAVDGTFALYMDGIGNDLRLQAQNSTGESNVIGPFKLRDSGLDGLLLPLAVLRSGRLAGMVVNQGGAPLPGMKVFPNRAGAVFPLEPAATNESGAFKLTGLPAGDYALVAAFPHDPGGRMAQGQLTVAIYEGQVLTGIKVVVETGELTISGRVVNSAGEPVAGANVSVHNGSGGTLSDAEGRFTIAGLEGGDFPIDATHEDYAWTHLPSVPAGSDQVKLVLNGKGTIEGQVVDATSGAPITEFEIFRARQEVNSVFENRLAVRDTGGRFTVPQVDAGTWQVTARARGFLRQTQAVSVIEHETSPMLTFRLKPGVRVEGVVETTAGAYVEGAYLYEEAFPHQEGGSEVARSGPNGHFAIDGWPSEGGTIAAFHPDYAPAMVEAVPGTRVRIVLEAAGQVEGVVRRQGNPLPALIVAAIYPDGTCPTTFATTGPDGSYALDGLAPGTLQVIADLPRMRDGKSLMEVITLGAGETIQHDFSFGSEAASLEGRITVGGQPAAGAQLMVLSDSAAGTRPAQVESDSEGHYAFEQLAPGSFTLRVEFHAEGLMLLRSLQLDVEDGASLHQDMDFNASPQRRISGTVLWSLSDGMNHGVAVFDANSALPDPSDATALFMATRRALSITDCREDGSYELAGLEPGRYNLVAMEGPKQMRDPSEIRFAVVEVTLGEDAPVTADFDFRK